MAVVRPIKEIVKQECKKRSISVAELARRVGMNPSYLYGVLNFTKSSRKAVFKVADYLHLPDLLYEYEKQLRSKPAEKQRKKPTSHKGGRKS